MTRVPISELTKDCPRADCRIHESLGGASTLLAWEPTYDKYGNRVDKGDPNECTSSMRCSTCGVGWILRTQFGETKVERI